MAKRDSITKQIVLGVLYSTPIPVVIFSFNNHVISYIAYVLDLFIPLITFCLLFGFSKNGPGSKFKGTRIIIAEILWGAFWKAFEFVHDSYLLETSRQINALYGFDRSLIDTVLFASYNVLAVALVVALSYVVGKRANNLIAG